MEPFAWPLAAVVLGIVFIGVFKSPITRFIDRAKKVSKDGVHTYDEAQQQQATLPQQPDALAQFLEGYHSPLLLEIESNLEQELVSRGLTNVNDANRALRKSLAGLLLILEFEKLENLIWASQVQALHFLNGRSPTGPANIEPFFTEAVAANPRMFEDRTFQEWLGFLTSQTLALVNEHGISITVRGREYLKWRVDQARSGPYIG